MSDENWPFGYGMCCCGCGRETNLAQRTVPERGHVKGEPCRYIMGHNEAISWARVSEAFWSRADRGDLGDCWPYAGVILNCGYGQVYAEGRMFLAHRVAWILANGDIPGGLIVRHLCNNRICCNPAHLAIGTQWDNADDRARAGRTARGERQGLSVLSNAQVLDIYARCSGGGETKAAIAEEYGVDPGTVSCIALGKTWAWLTGANLTKEEA
jgi:hypothetical protein